MIRSQYTKVRSSLYQFNKTIYYYYYHLNKLRNVISTGITCVILFAIIVSLSHLDSNANSTRYNYRSGKQLGRKSYIDHIDTNPSKYIETNVTGFVSNLDETHYMKDQYSQLYKDIIDCHDLQYNSSLRYQINELEQSNNNLINARREIIHWQNEVSHIVHDANDEKTMKEHEIVNKHWFEFGHVSVWVESYHCYLMYSRIIYTRQVKNIPEISFIKATAYDKDWKEIKGKQIPYLDTLRPNNFEQELEYLNTQLGLNKCDNMQDPMEQYEQCMKHQSDNLLKFQRRKKQILDKHFITYPTILKFSFKTRVHLSGPEDPHIILKQHKDGTEEPIIVFNLDDGDERKIHSILPHRRSQTLVKFLLPDKKALARVEKNWSPFLLPDTDYNHSLLSRGYIHFAHSFSPMRILRCSLDNGSCEEEFNGEHLNISPDNKDGDLRGGTQFVSLPDIIPSVKGKNIWVSFAKTHTKKCGCGPNFYRPALVVMIEQNGVYHLELVVPGIDFGIQPYNFDMTGISCKGKNVLTPNSIVSWFVASQDPSTHSFQDYMTVTVSEADAVTKRVVVNGVLDYILNIYNTKHIKDTFSVDDQADAIIDTTRRCVKEHTWDVCKKYGETHPDK